jgi:predicted DNA-binding protein (UPF0251 family)
VTKKIKRTDIDPKRCFTKSAYARHVNKSPARIIQMIAEGKLTIVIIHGGELVYE